MIPVSNADESSLRTVSNGRGDTAETPSHHSDLPDYQCGVRVKGAEYLDGLSDTCTLPDSVPVSARMPVSNDVITISASEPLLTQAFVQRAPATKAVYELLLSIGSLPDDAYIGTDEEVEEFNRLDMQSGRALEDSKAAVNRMAGPDFV
jgi:hypothetical protein